MAASSVGGRRVWREGLHIQWAAVRIVWGNVQGGHLCSKLIQRKDRVRTTS